MATDHAAGRRRVHGQARHHTAGPVTARPDARDRYTVAGQTGVWRYVGQATYVDDAGRTVEHDHVRMAPVGVDGPEVWVAPGDVRPVVPASAAGAA